MASRSRKEFRYRASGSSPPPSEGCTEAAPVVVKGSCCASAQPKSVVSDYKPKGTTIIDKVPTCDDLVIYESPYDPDNKPSRLIICAYDIFGFHENTKEVCDTIAEAGGFRVIMPDFYRGDYWDEKRSVQLMYSWVTYHGSWKTTHEDLINVIEHYKKTEGITTVGIFGFCWGGKISTLAGIEIPDIKAAGLVHPSGVTIDEADKINCPVIILPSRDEINLVPFKNKVIARFGSNNRQAEHFRFENMNHGFCAARGNFADPEVRDAVDEVIKKLVDFFEHHVK